MTCSVSDRPVVVSRVWVWAAVAGALIGPAAALAGARVEAAPPGLRASSARDAEPTRLLTRSATEAAKNRRDEFSDDARAAARSELGVRTVSIQRLAVEPHPVAGAAGVPGVLRVQVELEGRPRWLTIEPHSVRADDFAVYIGYGPGANDFAPIDRVFPVTTYRGWVEAEEGESPDRETPVVASYHNGRLTASVHGLERADGGSATVHRIQALSDLLPWAGAGVYAVYRDADMRGFDQFVCGVGDEHCVHDACGNGAPAAAGNDPTFGDRGVPACLRIADVLYDTDYEFTTHFIGRPDPIGDMLADIEFINNECDFIFQRDMGAAHNVKGVILRTDPSDPFSDATPHGTLLGQFRDLWAQVPLSNPDRDITHLMTGRDLDGGVIGVAYLSSVCRQDPNVGLSQTFFTSAANRRVMLTAHELGHQWNAPHDNQAGSACESTPSGFIMNPSIGNQPLQFSDCSIGRMTTYLGSTNGACVSPAPLTPRARPDFATVYVGDTIDLDVLRNDTSHCGDPTFTLGSSTGSAGGTLAVLSGAGPRGRNLVRYTPPAGFTGVDTFTYTASNEVGAAGPVTATVLVVGRKPAEFPLRTDAGLNVAYYEFASPLGILPDFSTLSPYLTGVVGAIGYASSNNNFAGSGRADAVAARFEGFFNATTAGVYTFFTESDDGSKLFVGDTLVVSNDGVHGMQERSGRIALEAGRHAIRVEYFERDGGAGLIARVQGPGLSKQVMPSNRLSRRLPCGTDLNGDDRIDLLDLLQFVSAWSTDVGGPPSPGALADRNADGVVDLLDLLEFLSLWISASCQ